MGTPGKGGPKKQRKCGLSLSEQAYQQEMDLLKLANESPYPEIRAAAIEEAKEIGKFQRKQQARVSPNLILGVILVFGLAALAECWYALVNYKARLAIEVCSLSIFIYLLIVAATLFLAGHLSETNFVKIIGLLASYVKAKWNSLKNLQNVGPHENEGDAE